jgi:hypothetical protein
MRRTVGASAGGNHAYREIEAGSGLRAALPPREWAFGWRRPALVPGYGVHEAGGSVVPAESPFDQVNVSSFVSLASCFGARESGLRRVIP